MDLDNGVKENEELAVPHNDLEQGEKVSEPAERTLKVKQTPQENAEFAAIRRAKAQLKPQEKRQSEFSDDYEAIVREFLESEVNAKQNPYRAAVVDRAMKDDLEKLQRIDPTVTDLEMLGDGYAKLIASGVDALTAYYAVRSASESAAPPKMGDISSLGREQSDYFTLDEVRAMTPAEINKNYQKVRKSMSRWK